VQPLAAGGVIAGVVAGGSFMTVAPGARTALVALAPDVMRFPYHARYELLEFAVYSLAGRAQGLVPLHAACVGRAGAGALVLGSSGAGKSTLMLHCLLAGLEFLAEDSVLVEPAGLLASGIGSFLHLRARGRHFAEGTRHGRHIARSPLILRRSRIAKFEVDLRDRRFAAATGAGIPQCPARGRRQARGAPWRRCRSGAAA
jgi:hypothetical protein